MIISSRLFFSRQSEFRKTAYKRLSVRFGARRVRQWPARICYRLGAKRVVRRAIMEPGVTLKRTGQRWGTATFDDDPNLRSERALAVGIVS
jgi:hypothetical protein